MKKLVLLSAVLLIGLLTACPGSVGIDEEKTDTGGLARVIIPLPVNENARAVGLPETKNSTNFFEVLFRKDNSGNYVYYSKNASADAGNIELQIPVGNYDVLLLAGNKPNAGSTPLLLASSFALNVNIILAEKNVINMELGVVDVDIHCDTNIIVGEQFSPSIEIDTKNPLLDAAMGVSQSLYFNKGDSSGDIWYQLDTINYSNIIDNVYVSELYTVNSLTSPLSTGSGSIKAVFLYPSFNTGDHGSWYLSDPSHPTLGQYYQKTINFIDGQAMPEVEINITWPTE